MTAPCLAPDPTPQPTKLAMPAKAAGVDVYGRNTSRHLLRRQHSQPVTAPQGRRIYSSIIAPAVATASPSMEAIDI